MRTKRQIRAINLLEQVKEGNRLAFASLFDEYSAALFGVLLKIIPDQEDCEDVLQDAFVKIWQKANFYDSKKGTAYTWMLNVCRNTAIDKLRAGKKISKFEIQSKGIDVSRNTGSKGETNIDRIGLGDLVERLNDDQKLLIDLVYFKGYTQREIADELDIPLGTVKTRIRSALKQLRGFFKLFFFWM